MFSFGATLYALTEGQPPFGRSENEYGLLYKISTGQVTPPVRSGPLTPLLTRLLAIEPADRPSAAQVAEELATLTGPRPGRRAWALVAAAVLVLLVATGVTASFLLDRDHAPASPAAALTTKDVDAFIQQHFAKLPNDTAGARQDWVPEFRPAEQKDDQHWKRYEVVAIYGEPRISATAQDDQRYAVELDLTLREQGAREHDVSIEGFRLDLVVRDGKLLIAHSREVGN